MKNKAHNTHEGLEKIRQIKKGNESRKILKIAGSYAEDKIFLILKILKAI